MRNYANEISQSAKEMRDLEAAVDEGQSKVVTLLQRAKYAVNRGESYLAAGFVKDAEALLLEVAMQKTALERLKEAHKKLIAEYDAL